MSFHLSNIPLRISTSAVRVDDSVPLQVVHEDEGFPAQRAAVGPLAAVGALVDPQAALLREPLSALSAAVRLLARVRPVVYAEVGRTLEVLAAHRAPERPLSLVALLVQLELVQTAERLAALRANVAPRHAGESFVGGLRGESGDRPVSGCRLPLGVFVRLPQICDVRGVSLRVHLLLLPVLLWLSTLRLETGRLRNILLILAVVDPVARPVRGQLLDASRLGRVRNRVSVRMVRECVGILLYHARKVRKASIDVITFNYRRPQLILAFVHGKVGSKLRLLPCAVLASALTESGSVLLLLRLDRKLKATDVSCKMTRAVQVAELRGFLPGHL